MPFTLTQKKTIPYAEQITNWYCGPACALMVLGFLGIRVANTDAEKENHQNDLFDMADKGSSGDPIGDAPEDWEDWPTTPQEMVYMLNHDENDEQQTKLWINYFASGGIDDNRGNFLAALRAITKDETEKPPTIVPVHSNSHWVVLAQYAENTTANGQISKSFSGKDPIYYKNETTNKDGSNSFQGTINIADDPLNFEPQVNLLLIKQSDITDSVTNAIIRQRPALIPPAPINLPANPISLETAPRVALQKLKEFGVTTPCLSGMSLNGTAPGTPFRVKRLDRPDGKRDYYLIGMQESASKENRMLVRLDVVTGAYLDSLSIPPTRYLLNKPRQDVALVESVKRQIAFYQPTLKTRQRWMDALQQTLASPEATLVWRPCEESLSAFYPFYDVKENNKTLFYVRIDGQIFPGPLHPIPKPLT